MFIHLFLTDECNLACRYCRGKIFDVPELERDDVIVDADIPTDTIYPLSDLYRFLGRDPGAVVTFIGGEPTLRPDLIARIMKEAPVSRFMIQTNGLLLNQLPSEIINRFETILVSIDGDEPLTDTGRGHGTYRRVMENIRAIHDGGYAGEIIARMTVHEETNIAAAVRYLADNPDYSFSSIHWQMDANFWNDYDIRRFSEWSRHSYNPGIAILAKDWVRRIRESGTVPRWYPFIDPIEDMLLCRKTKLRCGSGFANYTVLPDGMIAPCPIMVGMSQYYAGNIIDADPLRLPETTVPGRCMTCDIRDFCGGRCLYSAIMAPWPEEGSDLVCDTVRSLKTTLEAILPDIRDLISAGTISLASFAHEKYNGCEIIP